MREDKVVVQVVARPLPQSRQATVTAAIHQPSLQVHTLLGTVDVDLQLEAALSIKTCERYWYAAAGVGKPVDSLSLQNNEYRYT